MAIAHPLSALGLTDADELYRRVSTRMADVLRSEDDALSKPAVRMIEGSGKWARPIVVLATANALGVPLDDKAIDAAVCVELLHVGTLVHDDLMDDSDWRRGTPTVNSVEGWKSSIIVGDFILGRVGQLASGISAEVTRAVSDAIVAVCIGQSQETAQLYNADRTLEQAHASIRNKTAELLASACRIGALVGGASEETVERLGSFGRAFGMQFQIVDDVLDLVSDEERLGKPTGNDIHNGVFSVPVLLAGQDPSVSAELYSVLKTAADPASAARALELVRASTGCVEAMEEAHAYAAEAMEALRPLVGQTPALDVLGNLPTLYSDWALERHLAPQWQDVLRPTSTV